jgi:stearoyl-CoA desaturase (Delta-9 desaturase)
MIYGLLHLSFWGYALALIVMTQITIASVTIYLHRHQAHRALTLHPAISHFFRLWLWLTTGMTTKIWTAIHRKHHAKCEGVEDPHSPQVMGLKKVLWNGAELYRKEAKNQETLDRYGQGTPDDWIERHLYTPHSAMGILVMFILDLILLGVPGITIWALQMMSMPFFAAGVVNGIGHYFGYRNYECADAARNIIPWGWVLAGEELHNNHHAFGSSAKFSVKWWEFDLGWGYIKLLQWMGLAKIKKLPPKLQLVPDKEVIDAETIKALIINRLHVLSHYGKEVILPVLKAEKKRAGEKGSELFHRARMLLIRELSLFDRFERSRLALLLREKQPLRQVYYYRQKLQKIWNRTTASQKELIEALQEWCKSAENSGITSLKEFSCRLKSYVPHIQSGGTHGTPSH